MNLHEQLEVAADRLWSARPAADRRRYEEALAALRSSALIKEPVQCGEMVPDFVLLNALGEQVNLQAMLDAGPLLLTFILSAECELCRLAMRAYHQALLQAGLAESGIFVSLEPAVEAAAHLQTNEMARLLLGDPEGRVCRLFGLLYTPSADIRDGFRQFGLPKSLLDHVDAQLPLPATYVVDGEGIAVFAQIDADPSQRAEPAAVVPILQREASRASEQRHHV